ncbi:hypothetical protein DY000_02041097 [Brassica cretica]|uniref:Uncharacterized protein n=1 Tax=Brassica cretica TaxID=69181 RepID=A0ABQ7BNS7_BRACR|nr:hypothetical protein DY000_02041097 [Brassica cretica]
MSSKHHDRWIYHFLGRSRVPTTRNLPQNQTCRQQGEVGEEAKGKREEGERCLRREELTYTRCTAGASVAGAKRGLRRCRDGKESLG